MTRGPSRFAALALFALLAAPPSAAAATAGEPLGSFAACAARYKVVGLPRMKTDGSARGAIAICRTGYALAFDPDTRIPDWVIERLPKDYLVGDAQRRNNFKTDTEADALVPGSSPTNKDYARSGYDRGHQAPAGDFKFSQAVMDQSFYLTNMGPQVGIGFNRNVWKQLETDVRNWILCGGRPELYVITGPVFDSAKPARWIPKGKNGRVRVPDAYFKVIYDSTDNRALGMLLPNEKLNTADLPDYAVPIREIEAQTGIVFFPDMTKRRRNLLTTSASPLWGSDESCRPDP